MPEDYPYMMSNNKIAGIIEHMEKAAKPPKLTGELLKNWGFTSSNDRAIIPLFKRLGILDPNSAPTKYFDDVKDPKTRAIALGGRIRDTYSDLFSINTKIHEASDEEIKAAIGRVTGKDATSVDRYFATFKRLVGLADFKSKPSDAATLVEEPSTKPPDEQSEVLSEKDLRTGSREFHYNIQIHLPATTDISVYNAIFKSLKDHLDV